MPPRTVASLALIQMLTVLLGMLIVAIFLRLYSMGYWPSESPYVPQFSRIARDYGLWFWMASLIWTGVAIRSVRSVDDLPQVGPAYMTTGWVLWGCILLIYAVAIIKAWKALFGYSSMQGS